MTRANISVSEFAHQQGQRLIEFQEESEPIETTFELNDTLFAKAEVPATDEVYIWLGVSDPRSLASGLFD